VTVEDVPRHLQQVPGLLLAVVRTVRQRVANRRLKL
jgi:hypothetical protein